MSKSTSDASVWGREPVAIVAAVEAVILLAIGFGLPVTGEQVALINTALLAVLTLVARSQVTPVAKVLEFQRGDDQVVAGKANDRVKPGSPVRKMDAAA